MLTRDNRHLHAEKYTARRRCRLDFMRHEILPVVIFFLRALGFRNPFTRQSPPDLYTVCVVNGLVLWVQAK